MQCIVCSINIVLENVSIMCMQMCMLGQKGKCVFLDMSKKGYCWECCWGAVGVLLGGSHQWWSRGLEGKVELGRHMSWRGSLRREEGDLPLCSLPTCHPCKLLSVCSEP